MATIEIVLDDGSRDAGRSLTIRRWPPGPRLRTSAAPRTSSGSSEWALSAARSTSTSTVGALQGAQTNRGVFVTTGRFTPGARQFAQSVAMQLVLIDGEELTRLMVRYNVGVQVRETFDLKQVDEEFFEDS